MAYIHSDHLNTPRAATNNSGQKVWQWQSGAFGEGAANDDVDNDGTTLTLNLRFPGQYYDLESGLNYNYFRDYDPSLGRYVQSDPIGLDGGLNTYAYVSNNPLINLDPFGLNQMNHGPVGTNSVINTINVQMGSTILTPGKNGLKSAQTTGIGVGVYVQICPPAKEPPCEDDKSSSDVIPDAASSTFKYLVGLSITKNGLCLSVGPVISFPGIEFDTTGVHKK